MAAALLHSTTEEANYQRIARLVFIEGTTLLREIFDRRCPPSYLPKILQNPVTVKRLGKARLYKPQWDCLYPTPGVCGESKDFDLTLLVKLLTTICNITPPGTGWNHLPAHTDHSLAAELARVKYYRNLVCHQGMMKITDDEFVSLWKEISDSLLRLAWQISPEKRTEWQEVINKILTYSFVEEEKKVQELLSEWYKKDTQIKSVLTTLNQNHYLETVFQEKARSIKDLLREELKSKTRGVQEVKHLDLEGVERGQEGTTHKAKAQIQEEFPIKDLPGEVLQSAENLTSSACACIRLYINCEIISGPGLRESGSSEKDIALQEPQGSVQGPMVGSVSTTGGSPDAGSYPPQQHRDYAPIPKPGLLEESSQVSLGEFKGAKVGADLPSKQEILDFVAQKVFTSVDPSTPEELNGFVEYLENLRQVLIVATEKGSAIVTLECATLETLEGLWQDYITGLMDKVGQKCFVTDDITEEFGEVKLTTTMSEEEYKACRDYLSQVSGNSSPEVVSEDEIETGSMDRMESASQARYEVSERGEVWKLQEIQAAACITFPRNAVTKPELFRCTLWKFTTNFPPLKKDEALVSSVIVLTYDDPLSSNFTGVFYEEVTIALSHSACNLKGYEVVIRELVDSDNNEWRDLETTNIWQASDIQDDSSSKPEIPFAEAKVKCCSAFAVICRLKSYTYSTPADDDRGFTCIVHEFPDVSVSIPASVVHENKEFQLTLKVQEIQSQWFEESEMIVGPVLHITCSHNIELLEPATITIPISLQADKKEFSEFSPSNVKVLVHSDEAKSDWKDITHQLLSPADLTNGVVRFQVTHFSKWHVVHFRGRPKRAWQKRGVRKLPPWYKPNTKIVRKAGFFACLCSTDSPESDQFLLKLCCYPIHMKSRVKKEMHSEYRVLLHGAGNSIKQLCEGDDVRVATLNGLKAKKKFILRFIGVENYEDGAPVERDPRCAVPEISFVKYIRGERSIRLCELSLAPPALTTTTQRLTGRFLLLTSAIMVDHMTAWCYHL